MGRVRLARGTNLLSVWSLSMADAAAGLTSTTVLGRGANVYASPHALYVASPTYWSQLGQQTAVLRFALSDGVASFHGGLDSPVTAEAGAMKASVLVLHGGADAFISAESVAAFAGEMISAGADWRFVSYPGVKHSFTSPGADEIGARFEMPVAYDPAADADSWARLDAFLEEVFAD